MSLLLWDSCAINGALTAIAQGEKTMSRMMGGVSVLEWMQFQASRLKTRIPLLL